MAIIAIGHQRFSVWPGREQAESVSEPPAPRTLAHVSANGSHIANLRTGSVTRSVRQHWVMLLHLRILRDVDQSHQRSDPQSPCGGESDSSKDRKSTRLNSSHVSISYAVFCLKKKK